MLKLIIFHLNYFIKIDVHLQVSENIENSSTFSKGGAKKGKPEKMKSKKMVNKELSRGMVSLKRKYNYKMLIFSNILKTSVE